MAQAATTREGKGGISLPAIRVTAQRQPAPLRAGAGSAPPADHGSEAGAPERASSKGRARPVKELNLSDFEALVVETAKRLLANEHGNTATLRPSQIARELGAHRNDTALWTAIEDSLRQYRYRELDSWRLTRAEKKRVGTYLRYTRATLRCPLCGKTVRKQTASAHALTHLEKLERCGVLQLFRENGGWVVVRGNTKHVGAGWATLCRLAEQLAKEGVMVSARAELGAKELLLLSNKEVGT